jgi:hypothetical protein
MDLLIFMVEKMPQHIITETVHEHYQFKEAELNEADRRGWIATVIGLSFLLGLCYWLQP